MPVTTQARVLVEPAGAAEGLVAIAAESSRIVGSLPVAIPAGARRGGPPKPRHMMSALPIFRCAAYRSNWDGGERDEGGSSPCRATAGGPTQKPRASAVADPAVRLAADGSVTTRTPDPSEPHRHERCRQPAGLVDDGRRAGLPPHVASAQDAPRSVPGGPPPGSYPRAGSLARRFSQARLARWPRCPDARRAFPRVTGVAPVLRVTGVALRMDRRQEERCP